MGPRAGLDAVIQSKYNNKQTLLLFWRAAQFEPSAPVTEVCYIHIKASGGTPCMGDQNIARPLYTQHNTEVAEIFTPKAGFEIAITVIANNKLLS
jgi:hypothetical protein